MHELRKQQVALDGTRKFKLYLYCALGWTAALSVIMKVIKVLNQQNYRVVVGIVIVVWVCFAAMAITDVVLLVLTGIRIFKMSKTVKSEDHGWFEAEKNR